MMATILDGLLAEISFSMILAIVVAVLAITNLVHNSPSTLSQFKQHTTPITFAKARGLRLYVLHGYVAGCPLASGLLSSAGGATGGATSCMTSCWCYQLLSMIIRHKLTIHVDQPEVCLVSA